MEWTIGWWQVSVQRVYPTQPQLSQTYNQAAQWWNQQLQLLRYDAAYTKLWRSLQQNGVLANLKDNSRICDCGVGTSAFSLTFATTVHASVWITGVDISPKMLGKADQLLSQANINHQLFQSDVNTLPFEDNHFDVVMSAHMLEHLPNPAQGLHEMVRVLRPGAPLILAVTRPGLLGWWIQWQWGNNCFSETAIARKMTEAGLVDVQIHPFTVAISRWTSLACIGLKPI